MCWRWWWYRWSPQWVPYLSHHHLLLLHQHGRSVHLNARLAVNMLISLACKEGRSCRLMVCEMMCGDWECGVTPRGTMRWCVPQEGQCEGWWHVGCAPRWCVWISKWFCARWKPFGHYLLGSHLHISQVEVPSSLSSMPPPPPPPSKHKVMSSRLLCASAQRVMILKKEECHLVWLNEQRNVNHMLSEELDWNDARTRSYLSHGSETGKDGCPMLVLFQTSMHINPSLL